MVQVKWANQAFYDLKEIHDFIARDSVQYAKIQIERILDEVLNLSHFPLIGRHVPEFPDLPYREIIVGNYRTIYKIKEKQNCIFIMSVVHGRQLLNKTNKLKHNL